MPFWFNLFFQESNSPSMEYMIFFNDYLMIINLMIISILTFMFFYNFAMKSFSYEYLENQSLEDSWLMIPLMFLLFIGFPSIKNLYMFEEYLECDLNFKINGNQWYWTYSMDKFSADMIMNKNYMNFRLMECFNHLIVPIKCPINILLSSNDVIHSWGVPSLCMKMDAMPGRISQSMFICNRSMMIVGECMEICGANHSFMPILISSISLKNF